ncbi:MAG TPA: CsgG/HfaB family protein [Bryobacteraceae bacterium]|nr:CsgG/HfaB family protein [Bryobacteraceae bacterium]
MKIRGAVVVLLASTAVGSAQTKKALSIDPFDYSAVMTAVQSIFGTQVNIGQGIQAMLTQRITQDGRFTVVERRKVNQVMHEQDFDASNRVKRGTGARIGQIRGADLTLMGDIVVFGRDDRRVGGGAGGGTFGAGAVVGGYKATGKAVVVLDYRIVDVETSEVIASGEARGESKRTSAGGGAGFWVPGGFGGGGVNMTASNFGETIIGEATMDAVNKLSADIAGKVLQGGASDRTLDLDALVADVSGSTITINAGAAAGLQTGQTFTVYHKGKVIKDPATGEVLDVQTTPIGQITITMVRDKISMGNYNGSATPVVGDVVRK